MRYCTKRPSHAFGHAILLWCIGSGKFVFFTCAQAVSLKSFAVIFIALIGVKPDDSTAEGDKHCGDIGLKRSKSLILTAEQVNGVPSRELVGDLARIFITCVSCRSEWLY